MMTIERLRAGMTFESHWGWCWVKFETEGRFCYLSVVLADDALVYVRICGPHSMWGGTRLPLIEVLQRHIENAAMKLLGRNRNGGSFWFDQPVRSPWWLK